MVKEHVSENKENNKKDEKNEEVEEKEGVEEIVNTNEGSFELTTSVEIIDMFKDALSVEDIARMYGTTPRLVLFVLREYFRCLTGHQILALGREVDAEILANRSLYE